MKTISRLFPFLAFALFSVAGCSEADTEPPLISDLTITPAPGAGMICGQQDDNVIHVSTGDSITVSFTATDNEELSQYKIDVHNNFDCHGHAKLEASVWEVIDIGELQGVEQQVTRVLRVPDSTAAGAYHFSIQVADFFGNSAKTEIFHVRVLNLEDTVPPTLTVTQPAQSALTINTADTLTSDSIRFVGNLSDNRNLGLGGNGLLELRYWRVGSNNIFDLFSIQFTELDGDSYDFDFTVALPSTLVLGDYILELRGFDGVNNQSEAVRFTVTLEGEQEEDDDEEEEGEG